MVCPSLTSPLLAQQPQVKHAFFTRQGGVSAGRFASLNCGLGGKDDAEAVAENRRRARQTLSRKDAPLASVAQVHSPRVVTLEAPFPEGPRPEADALVTKTPGLTLGVLTADCAPLLFADAKAGVIGAAHAGWRGALDGVAEATLEAMADQGAELTRIAVAIGPCIAQASYEVGPEFKERFLRADAENVRFFRPGSGDRHHFDLKGYVAARLRAAGVTEITVEEADTCADAERFFSNRRTMHQGGGPFGSLLSAILLED